jgi:hypothetical protein
MRTVSPMPLARSVLSAEIELRSGAQDPATLQAQLAALAADPRLRARIAGATAWAAKNWWRRLVAMRSSQYSGVTSATA